MKITNLIKQLIKETELSPKEINNGNCVEFANALAERLSTIKVYETGLDKNGNFNIDPIHNFIKYNNKFFDAERPKGLKNYKNLPFYKNQKPKCKAIRIY